MNSMRSVEEMHTRPSVVRWRQVPLELRPGLWPQSRQRLGRCGENVVGEPIMRCELFGEDA